MPLIRCDKGEVEAILAALAGGLRQRDPVLALLQRASPYWPWHARPPKADAHVSLPIAQALIGHTTAQTSVE